MRAEAATPALAPPRVFAEPSPCDRCGYWARCANERLACERFSMFVHSEGAVRWKRAPIAPTRWRYNAVMEPLI